MDNTHGNHIFNREQIKLLTDIISGSLLMIIGKLKAEIKSMFVKDNKVLPLTEEEIDKREITIHQKCRSFRENEDS